MTPTSNDRALDQDGNGGSGQKKKLDPEYILKVKPTAVPMGLGDKVREKEESA